MKTLLALIERPGHVCYRYRAAAFAPWLRDAGWSLEPLPIERGLGFFRQLPKIARADAVLLQRRLLSWWQIRLLRARARRLLFDIDDAVFYRDSNSDRGHESVRRRRRFDAIAKRADVVLAGNAFLAEEAGRVCRRVEYVPTCIDPTLYQPHASDRIGGAMRLVWIGSRSTMASLNELQPGLAEATRRLPGLRLRVICDAFPTLEGVAVEPVVWSERTEAAELTCADVGISHLPEHPWSLGKCGLKVVQYMAAGIPVLANPYGVHTTMIEPGVNGYLPRNAGEWADAIVTLASDPSLRVTLGSAARRRAQDDFSIQTWGPRLVEILREFDG